MTEVKIVADCDASAETAFAYVNDYRNLPRFLREVQEFTPVGSQTEGVGATFDGHIKLGPVSLNSRIQVVRWEPHVAIGVKSIKGFEVESTFLFHAKDAERCTVDAIVDYRVPGGLAGKALGKTIEPFVKIAVKHSTDNLTKQIAEFHRTRGADGTE
ncbi:SRPBCC family protein [Nocardia cyriacigeorgica]|uniref:SRPBCC family protein n=1 Tax=Nocardia cyriacigeorgica TaxID=135487 RepID=UPI0013D8D134|nr:SRPBCC family protein [Nocardia cyriacigeorgica]MBF6437887.1 SRPBCC family protein [Nocardia cyriacigeorgica]MBF6453436.1 SRPBCC family protein [Nocardia cyriacigeorgica]MBF6477139.1 SRPBCC family protein [Nocardia cyriacigeorgica]MBF6550605.1 SRPBCC family protein [Nocardia cyriacigeorgica]NEW29915.1 SRPBCC family protein [Nocardia cyriacigeorgica]